MQFLQQMMKETEGLLREIKRQERVLKRILKILQLAGEQRDNTRAVILLMLDYEQHEQRMRLEQKGMPQGISRKQKEEYEKDLQLFHDYVVLLTEYNGRRRCIEGSLHSLPLFVLIKLIVFLLCLISFGSLLAFQFDIVQNILFITFIQKAEMIQ